MQLVLSTRNPSKVEQAKAVFAGSDISIISLDEAGIEGQAGTQKHQGEFRKKIFSVEDHGNYEESKAYECVLPQVEKPEFYGQ